MKIKITRKLPSLFSGILFLLLSVNFSSAQLLKSMVYDFDGLDIGQTSLPEGDYRSKDLTYSIAANPLPANDMLGDRVLKLNLNWNSNYGAFGRGISRFIEFNPATDMFNFFFYNPISNNQNATFSVVITDDDNQNYIYEYSGDDTWKKTLSIAGSSGWQLVSIPLNDFVDTNPGGNGVFDIAFTQNKGMLLMVEFQFSKKTAGLSNPVFYIDMIHFSDGPMPHGATVFDLPSKNSSDFCLLGAYQSNARGKEYLIPSEVESLFPAVAGKKLKYANYFLAFALDGTTTAKELPGNEVQILLNNGYRPIITWEPLFKGMARLDPRQPNLNRIISGEFNSYIDKFADKMKSYNDTVIIRFMHEFEGNWYPWSLVVNNQNPGLYVTAFRKVVDRFRARGATKVKWMWCLNSDYYPYRAYNWVVPAYPGDAYVDIIGSDIYNDHYPVSFPWWRSFRWKNMESYYYIHKYFPQKPHYMCELGCRERFSSENPASQSKGAWYAAMDKELQSNFHKMRALIFFNGNADQNWTINSSASALQSLTNNIWYDNYYFKSSSDLQVNITSPPNNSSYSVGATITLTTAVSGGTGVYQKMEFFSNGVKSGEDFTSPYGFTWTGVSAGYYQIKAKITDNANNTATSAPINITVGNNCSANGLISRELWFNISGTSVSNIPLSTAPSGTGTLNIFEAPSNIADNYGQRIRGYICPPLTGNYIFWIASDDNSELWLSTNNLVSNKRKIAYSTGWTKSREWTKYASQQSAAIYLVAGQKYYIEALHKEGSLSDNLAVGWKLPNGTLERPIPGSHLSGYVSGLVSTSELTPADSLGTIVKSKNPPMKKNCTAAIFAAGSTTFCDKGKVILYSDEKDSSTSWQWIKDGKEIEGETKSFYAASEEGNYQLKISNESCIAWSAPAKISVNPGFLTASITPGGRTVLGTGGHVILYANTCSDYIYQWEKDNEDIPGANQPAYIATTAGNYQVKIIKGSSAAWSSVVQVKIDSSLSSDQNISVHAGKDSAFTFHPEEFLIKIFPNPTTGLFSFEIFLEDMPEEVLEVRIITTAGEPVFSKPIERINRYVKETIELDNDLPGGIYIMQIRIGNEMETTKIILNR